MTRICFGIHIIGWTLILLISTVIQCHAMSNTVPKGKSRGKELETDFRYDKSKHKFKVTSAPPTTPNARAPPPEPVLELGLFVTSDLVDSFYKKFNVTVPGGDIFQSTLLTNYLRGMNDLFGKENLVADLNVKVKVTRYEVIPKSIWSSWKGIQSFCKYQSNYTDVDVSMLIILRGGAVAKQMKVFALGQTYRQGVCARYWRCGMIQENELLFSASRRLIVHELAHSLGLTDQGRLLKRKLQISKSAQKLAADGRQPYDDLSCIGAHTGMMTGRGETWLNCSVKALERALKSKYNQCLYKDSGDSVTPDGTFVGLMKYMNREEMCRLYLNSTSWIAGSKMIYNGKGNLPLCQFGREECMGKYEFGGGRIRLTSVSGQSWPTGTMCLPYVYDKLCYHGECLAYNEILQRNDDYIRSS